MLYLMVNNVINYTDITFKSHLAMKVYPQEQHMYGIMHVKTPTPIVFYQQHVHTVVHHRFNASYFPALMCISSPEKQQFYPIYSLEQDAVTRLLLLSVPIASAVCCCCSL